MQIYMYSTYCNSIETSTHMQAALATEASGPKQLQHSPAHKNGVDCKLVLQVRLEF